MASESKPKEIFTENIQLKEFNAKLNRFKERAIKHHPSLNDDEEALVVLNDEQNYNLTDQICRKNPCSKQCRNKLLKILLFVLVAGFVIAVYVVAERRHDSTLKALVSTVTSSKEYTGGLLPLISRSVGSGLQDSLQKLYLNIGMRQDYQLQECQGPELKQSFPDVDYALLGYNILKGFPLATGHDPGFTYPIFKHDYSSGGMTADCRYSVPRGLVIIPDVSCVTSFSSTTIQTKYEFSKALSVSASVSGGGWGVSFSASAGYKESSSEVSTGESVYILSSAHCNYYFSKLISEEAPQLDNVFVKWVHKMNKTDLNSTLYFEFFETYGTHFPTEVTFGARFSYEHKMSSSKYETEKKSGVNVAVQASYSGLVSVGGGFNMDSDQRQAASDFSKSVETKTITVGAAPPANGDAMTWASEVKTSPVPTAYKLSSIENLFTDRYMAQLNVDHTRIQNNIASHKKEYCLYLRNEGQVESCEKLAAGIQLAKTRLFRHYKEIEIALQSECIQKCLDDVLCVAITTCTRCQSDNYAQNTCYMYKEPGGSIYGERTESENSVWQSNVFSEKMKSHIEISDTAVIGDSRGFEKGENKGANETKCHELCTNDAHCVAYSHCNCPDKVNKCNMYGKDRISGLAKEDGTKTVFISGRQQQSTTTQAPSTTTQAVSSTDRTMTDTTQSKAGR